jgi:hypothetical protein
MTRFFTVFFIAILTLVSGNRVMAQAVYDTVSIHDLQYVPDPVTSDASPYNRDTLVVRAMVMHSPRTLYVGARWACYVVDPDSLNKPWSGFFLIQNDTTGNSVNTNFGFVEPGMIIYATGVMDEYFGFTELALLTNPVVPITIESTGNALPEPLKLTANDLDGFANGEQWESMLVMLENETIVNNQVSSNQASMTDASEGTTFLDDYFLWFRTRFDNNTYDWPAPGTRISVTGYTRDVGPGKYTVNPENGSAIEILTNPPTVTNIRRSPGVPTSNDDVTVSATIVDNLAVKSAAVYYSVNWGPYSMAEMTADADTFSGTIPKQADGSMIRYYIYADDNDGDWTTNPGDTSTAVWIYPVRDGALTIKDIQYTYGYQYDASPYRYYDVTIQGVVVTDSTDSPASVGCYYISQKDSAWYGMWIADYQSPFVKGDLVEVTGTVAENFGVTRIENVTSANLISSGNSFNPVPVSTGDINTTGPDGEAYESVLIELSNLTVINQLPDAPGNYGEFTVSDGSGELRVDDWSLSPPRPSFPGNHNNDYTNGDTIEKIIALGYYSFSNYKVLPRDTNDVIGHVVSAIGNERDGVAREFALEQNYPNPFNPETNISYQVSKPGNYTLTVYNVLGQTVNTLVNGFHNTGTYTMKWNGLDSRGNRTGSGLYFYRLQGEGFVMTRKMVLLK